MANSCIYFDFEYNDSFVVCGHFIETCGQEVQGEYALDFRDGRDIPRLQELMDQWSSHLWLAYAAGADLEALLRLGRSISGLRVVDIMVESRMITMSHGKLLTKQAGLLGQLAAFGIPTETDRARKEIMRLLILQNTEWTDEQWTQILDYCREDVVVLPRLMRAIQAVHQSVGTPTTVAEMVARGEFIKANAAMDFRTRGFPVDTEWMTAIFEARPEIRRSIAEDAIEEYGPIYRWNKSRADYSFNFAGLEDYVAGLPVGSKVQWPRTDTGRLKTDSKTVTKLVRRYPFLLKYKQAEDSRKAMASRDLRELVKDHHIKPVTRAYSTKTGRNAPKPTEGFVPNLPPWMRTFLRPQPGRALIGADWSAQEIAVAAGISGDTNLRDAYLSGDLYIALAKMAGAVPPDATKETHENERQTFKAVQLGISYGKQVDSLAMDVWQAQKGRITFDKAYDMAAGIMKWHKGFFGDYWTFIDEGVRRARRDGYYRTPDGWTCFVDRKTKETALINWPVQANAGLMMRRATLLLAERNVEVIASHHDAFYLGADAEDVERTSAVVKSCMDEAAATICRFPVPVDISVYTWAKPYRDGKKRDLPVLEMLAQRVGIRQS